MDLLKIFAASATNTSSNVASSLLQRAAMAAYDTLASSAPQQQQQQPYRNTRSQGASSQRQAYAGSSSPQQDLASTIFSSIIYYATFALSLASRYLPASYLTPLAILSHTSTLYGLITRVTTLDFSTIALLLVSSLIFFKAVAYLFRWVLWWVRVALRLAGVVLVAGAVMYVAGRGLEGSLHDVGEIVGWGMGVMGEGGHLKSGGAKGTGYGSGATGARRNVGGRGAGGGRWT